MKSSKRKASTGSDRMNGLLAWWGIPGASAAGEMDARVKRALALVVDLDNIIREASSRQSEALSEANEEIVRALQQLLSARQPADLVSAQSRIVTGLLQSFAVQTGAWAESTRKMLECCSVAAREGAAEAAERVAPSLPVRAQSHAERAAAEEAATGPTCM